VSATRLAISSKALACGLSAMLAMTGRRHQSADGDVERHFAEKERRAFSLPCAAVRET
jgi:hypothetical protein